MRCIHTVPKKTVIRRKELRDGIFKLLGSPGIDSWSKIFRQGKTFLVSCDFILEKYLAELLISLLLQR
jgi:hypothetical protein